MNSKSSNWAKPLETTIAIATIGRHTLKYAIQSALDNHFKVIVVADGVNLTDAFKSKFPDVKFYKTGHKFGYYGFIASTMAAYLVDTEFVSYLGDDDEIITDKGQILKDKINTNSADIWVPGQLYNNGQLGLIYPGLKEGNVGSPSFRVKVLAHCPMRYPSQNEWKNKTGGMDYWHAKEAVKMGFKIQWVGEPIIAVRPKLKGNRGYQQSTKDFLL